MFKLQLGESILSKLAIILSSICLVHCLSMPLIILLLPTVASFLSTTFELILMLSVIPLSIAAFLPRWLKHRNYKRLYVFGGGITLIVISQILLQFSHTHTSFNPVELAGTTTLFAGVVMISTVLYLQNKHTHTCSNPNHKH